MAFNPTVFSMMVVTDTCAVWNILSSRKLSQAAREGKVTFCLTPMVLYECLQKPRKILTSQMEELIRRLNISRRNGDFPVQGCDINDLLTISRGAPSGLGSGELSCIAAAFRITSLSFMTDERKARIYAENNLRLKVETTPRLYGWLHFKGYLTDSDHADVLSEHEIYERRPLTPFFNEAYESALQHRLMQHP